MKKRAINCKIKNYKCHTCGGCFYFLGFLGSLIYYLSTAAGFWNGILGILKSFVWPVFLVNGLLKFLGS